MSTSRERPAMHSHSELPSLRATLKLGGQDGKGKVVPTIFYDVKFYPYTPPGVDPVFAVTGSFFTIVGRCKLDSNNCVDILRWFEDDEDENVEGDPLRYNSVAWSQAENGDPLLCVTGNTSQIKVLNVKTGELVTTLIGHGGDIHDLAVSPTDPTIMASASLDHTVRLWTLDLSHKQQPVAAICYGQGHKDQVLCLSYHQNGRYILSGGIDTRVNLWMVPDNLKDNLGTDKPVMVHYPHFSTTEIHTDFVDCIQFYHDVIISWAARENKIIIWRIDNFNSDRDPPNPAPIPSSRAVSSQTPVTIPASSVSGTRSAWGGRFQRLLTLDIQEHEEYYMRFGLFHEINAHPILVAGNEKSRVFFWDLQRLEENKYVPEPCRNDISSDKRTGPSALARHVREDSSVSTASSAAQSSTGAPNKTTKGKEKDKERSSRKDTQNRGTGDPFRALKAHKQIEVPGHLFKFRKFAWSKDGQWCIGVGDFGLINVFHRWENGAPHLSQQQDEHAREKEIANETS